MNPKHWKTVDGHRYVSVPTTLPAGWARTADGYVRGPYSIIRRAYGSSCTFTLFRDGFVLPLAFYFRLKDAKARAEQNAKGRDVVNVA